jgi:hypothetical protein
VRAHGSGRYHAQKHSRIRPRLTSHRTAAHVAIVRLTASVVEAAISLLASSGRMAMAAPAFSPGLDSAWSLREVAHF